MDRNALDWLFSTLPQALAALCGLIFAGVSFITGQIDERSRKEDSLSEILEKMKEGIYFHMKMLFSLSFIAILFDSIVIFANPIRNEFVFSLKGSFDWYYLLIIIFFVINIGNFLYAFYFTLSLVAPRYMEDAIIKLKNELSAESQNEQTELVKTEEFLKNFQSFESKLKDKFQNECGHDGRVIRLTVKEMLDFLLRQNIIDKKEYEKLRSVNRTRNIIVHSSYEDNVPKIINDILNEFVNQIPQLRRINW